MEKVKVGDKVKVMKIVTRMGGTYEVGDVLTVMETFSQYPGYVRTNKGALSPDEYEIVADEIKTGDKVRLIDEPWEHPLWATFGRMRRRAYSEMIGKEITVCEIIQSPALVELKGIPCANTGKWFIPLAMLRKVEPVEAKHRYTDEQITEAKCYLAEKTFNDSGWTITKPTEAHPVAVISGHPGIGTAKCAPDDEFNAYIGLMVAFKRYYNEPLPTWIRG